ncbi:MAG: aspartate aminotransferase family protein [Mesorhizobium amorphae]|nr:MAG: aspartate aminotransferase family protein [Mesorhizobium amorphae]
MTSLYAREARSVSSLAHLRFFPLALTGGVGALLRDETGREVIDFAASWGAVGLGHAHPAVREAVGRALSDQAGASYLSTANLPAIELAETLLALVPERARGRVWFGHSGSDANETAARIVTAATGRPRILAFAGAYHGGTVGSAAISGHPSQSTPKAPGLMLVPYPNTYADGEKAGEAALAEIDRLFAGPVPPEEVAAFFIEPIQSDGGMLVPPETFFREVEKRCRAHGILLVSDEVKVGLGRTGSLHGFAQWNIEPDMVVLGKGLGNGLPISALIGPEAVMNFAPAFAFQTLHGNPVCAAAGLAVIETIRREGLAEQAAETGRFLREGLEALRECHALIGDVRGRGLALGVELVVDCTTREPAREATALGVLRAFELGLCVFYVGTGSNVIELTPPLTLSRSEAERGLDILDRSLRDVAEGRVSPAALEAFAGW